MAAVRITLPRVLEPMCKVANWVLWKSEIREGSKTKPPYQAKRPGRRASAIDQETWSSCDEALAAAVAEGLSGTAGGIGFVFYQTRFGCVDLDNCINDDGTLEAWAGRIVRRARELGCYAEISPSMKGVHVFGRASGPEVHTRWGVNEGGGRRVEVFRSTRRFVSVTGKAMFEHKGTLGFIDDLIDELLTGRPEGKPEARKGTAGDSADSSPSGLFNRAVCKLLEQGLNTDEIVAMLRKYPKRYDATSIAKYEQQGRLQGEVERIATKWVERNGARLEVMWSTGRLPKAKTLADALIAVDALGITCSNDTFHVQHYVEGEVLGSRQGVLTDEVVAYIRGLILKKYGFDTGKEPLSDALFQTAIENSFDPVRAYLDGVQASLNGRRRLLDDWVVRFLGCPDTELNRTIGKLWLVAAVRRVRRPGAKFDQIVVLEGVEGTNKSTAIEVLAGEDNFSDQSILDVRHGREQQELVQGVWLLEIPDLKGLSAADVNVIKAICSRRVDRARPAYGKRRIDQPRRFIMVATTNDERYLKGATGNRRWWPLQTGEIDIEGLRRNRDQLWAEAAALEATGMSIELPEHLWAVAKREQNERLEQDPWDDRLRAHKGTRWRRSDGQPGWEERVPSSEVYQAWLGLRATDERGGGTARRVSEVMRRLGWEPKQAHAVKGGPSVACWVRLRDE